MGRFKTWPLWTILTLIVLLTASSFWIKNASRWPDYRRLTHGGRATTGWVTAKGLNGERKINYSFAADGRIYSGQGRAGFGTPNFSALQKGDDVLVFYLPQEPEISVLGDPGDHLRQQNRVLAFVLTFIALAVFLAIRKELRRGVGEAEGFSERKI